jgi:hypothetical protein
MHVHRGCTSIVCKASGVCVCVHVDGMCVSVVGEGEGMLVS